MDRDEYYEACIVALAALADCFQKFEDAYLAGDDYPPITPAGRPMTQSQLNAQAKRFDRAFNAARDGMIASFGDAGDFSD